VGAIQTLVPAATIVAEMVEQAEVVLGRLASLDR
jgi:hypothetical protein